MVQAEEQACHPKERCFSNEKEELYPSSSARPYSLEAQTIRGGGSKTAFWKEKFSLQENINYPTQVDLK